MRCPFQWQIKKLPSYQSLKREGTGINDEARGTCRIKSANIA